MQVLTQQEINMVHGGDSWAGTPEGREPVPTPEAWIDCVQREGGYPGVSELGAMLSCTGQKIREWVRMF